MSQPEKVHDDDTCPEDVVPVPGTYAYTARLMAEIFPGDDPDFWDRWKDEQKDRSLGL